MAQPASSNHIMNRRIRCFRMLNEQTPIQEYMNIPKKEGNNSLNIDIVNITNNKINLKIKYVHKYDGYYFEELPAEINNMIDKYLYETLIINISIHMPEIYPWRPARWSLTNISTKKSKQRVLLNYYYDKIKYHNQLNREKWSIVISMEKDILFFISSIINFKDVITA